MIIYVDIDKTICDTPLGKDYASAIPRLESIAKINKLYNEGHYIVYWTARGSLTNKQKFWLMVTRDQLLEWNAGYSELRCDKPFYDIFIDDKALNKIEDLDNVIHNGTC